MRVYFDDNDVLMIKADNKTEAYALRYWCDNFSKDTKEGLLTDKMIFDFSVGNQGIKA